MSPSSSSSSTGFFGGAGLSDSVFGSPWPVRGVIARSRIRVMRVIEADFAGAGQSRSDLSLPGLTGQSSTLRPACNGPPGQAGWRQRAKFGNHPFAARQAKPIALATSRQACWSTPCRTRMAGLISRRSSSSALPAASTLHERGAALSGAPYCRELPFRRRRARLWWICYRLRTSIQLRFGIWGVSATGIKGKRRAIVERRYNCLCPFSQQQITSIGHF